MLLMIADSAGNSPASGPAEHLFFRLLLSEIGRYRTLQGGLWSRKALALLQSDAHNFSLLFHKTMLRGSLADRIQESRLAMSLMDSADPTPDSGTWTSGQTVTPGPDKLMRFSWRRITFKRLSLGLTDPEV